MVRRLNHALLTAIEQQRRRSPAMLNRSRRRGMTLVELMMALGIMALISVAIGGMLTATAYGTRADHDLQGLVVRAKTTTMRLNAALRGSRQVLEHGRYGSWDYVVLWTRDLDGNGQPSLQEIRGIVHDTHRQTVDSYVATASAGDTVFNSSTNYASKFATWVRGGSVAGTKWIEGVEDFTLSFNKSDLSAAKLVNYRVSLRDRDNLETAVGTVLLRNHEEGG